MDTVYSFIFKYIYTREITEVFLHVFLNVDECDLLTLYKVLMGNFKVFTLLFTLQS